MNQQAYSELIDEIQAIAEELETSPGYDMLEESAPVVGDLEGFETMWEDR